MTRSICIFAGSIMAVLLLVTAVIWFAGDRLLDDYIRPQLCARASQMLDAEVGLERLELDAGRMLLTGLSMVRPGQLELEVAEIELRFAWSGLLRGRIGELLVRQPRLVWKSTDNEPSKTPAQLPVAAPLQIEAWHLEGGSAELHWGDQQVKLDRVMAAGALAEQFPFNVSGHSGSSPGVSLRLRGNARWQNGLVLTLDELSWDEKNLLTRTLQVTPGSGQDFAVQLGLAQLDAAEVAGLLAVLGQPIPWPDDLSWYLLEPAVDFSLQGGRFTASLRIGGGFVETAGQRWPWQKISLRLQGVPERLELQGRIDLPGSGTLTLDGNWGDQQLNGDWQVLVASPAALLQSLAIDLPMTQLVPRKLSAHGRIEAGRDTVRISAGRLEAVFAEKAALSVDLQGEWREQRLSLSCDRLVVGGAAGDGPLVEARLAVSGTPGHDDWRGEWSMQMADASRLAGRLGFEIAKEMPNLQGVSLNGGVRWRAGRLDLAGIKLSSKLTGTGITGRLLGRFDLRIDPGADLSVRVETLQLEALEYQAEDGMAGLVGGQLTLAGQLDLKGEQLNFDLSGKAVAEEALLQSWYGSLAGLPIGFTLRGGWQQQRRTLQLVSADVDLAGLVGGGFAGTYTDTETTLRGQLLIPRLDGAFLAAVKALGGELLPGMQQLSMGGRLMLDCAVRSRPGDWSLNLSLEPSAVTIAWGESLRVDGLTGRLPIHLRQGAVPAEEIQPEAATLNWSNLQGELFRSVNGRLELSSSINRWRLQQPLVLTVAGGELRLSALQADLQGLVPHLQAALAVSDVELLQVARILGWPEMGGLLNARFDDIRIAGDEISTAGEASVRVFGGDFSISNMRVESPFSRFPTYHADVDFSAVDLYQLTNTFAFGEMNGVADGYIHDLRLFDGIPSAFRASLETRPEGTRNISVKAIRNLNTLSQGGLSSALSQGIYKFIDFYRYRKIGILCSLQNDLFHLEGTAREGSAQYLVYGGLLPPRIDVLVSSPTISFKEIVKRLKRIERAER